MSSDRRLQINELIHGNGKRPDVYRFAENDREYFAFRNAVIYPFPCDEDEERRLDQFHYLIHDVALNGKPFIADLQVRGRRPQILDVGHGTGIWLLETAEIMPNVDFHGIDLIDNQARPKNPHPNVDFRTPVDFTSPNWGFRDSSFDLIRMSQLCGCVPDWLQQYRIVHKYLKPGTGCVEHIEIDWTPRLPDKNGFPVELLPLKQWWDCMGQASRQRPIAYQEDTGELLTNAGFTDITHKTFRISLQSHPKDGRDSLLKRLFRSFMCWRDDNDGGVPRSFEALSMSLFYRELGISADRVRTMCDTLRSIYLSDQWPIYHNIQIWTARKPMS